MKNKNAIRRSSQAGVSLVELMVGLTIGLVVTAGAMTILFSNQKLVLEKDVMDRTQENFRFASTTITRMVRQATSFGVPNNNNELIVHFNPLQRDCLGQIGNSGMNTFKVNDQNELQCILELEDGSRQIATLAKNISEIKFSYGIQNGTSANSLVYQPYFNGASGTVNTNVSNVRGSITSILSEISVLDGSGKQPTIDFIATSHLLAMTQLASSGGVSKVNPPTATTPPTTTPPTTTPPTTTPPTGNTDDGSNTTTPPVADPDCSNDVLGMISITVLITGNKQDTTKTWGAFSGTTIYAIKNGEVRVDVNTNVKLSKWTISLNSGPTQELKPTQSYPLPDKKDKTLDIDLECNGMDKGSLEFKTTNN
ncbi:hypothetical protein ABCA12_2656 [Acinetobacter junii]|uniref:PilW family protein n=1 Tax=Acinetobacter junii TaxID=40215 RepID=UPI00191E2983|nr:prepilin-type N-terminal cleavage/methylation domain-containing protein [Acinetobacter junii]QQV67206.1 hypothetical protein ABCA12_2656 [Acinetobacter junii]